MKPPKPMPTEPPFLTLVTMTHLRPAALVRNLASVGRQTAVEHIEQIVLPDHVGYGLVNSLYVRAAWYAHACRGHYVGWLSDDDELADERVVEELKAFIEKKGTPPVVLVDTVKGELRFPKGDPLGPPVEGDVDLGSYVLRRDIWQAYAHRYGRRYAGDYDHAQVMWDDGLRAVYANLLFARGPISNGRPEISL